MFMIPTIRPYGSVNIRNIKKIAKEQEKYYFIDNYGWWEITERDYEYLKGKGIPEYGRVHSTLRPI